VALAITVILLIIARIATSYNEYKQTPSMDDTVLESYTSSPPLSQHNIDVIVGKAPPPSSTTLDPVQFDTSVLVGKVKVKEVAVIFETRPLSYLLPLLLHFSSVLGAEWPMYVFTPPSTVKTLEKSLAFNQSVDDGRIKHRGLLMVCTILGT
jgi:hypothetical protein